MGWMLYMIIGAVLLAEFVQYLQLRLLKRELSEAREEIRAVARQSSRIDARTEHLAEIIDRDTGF